MELQKEKKRINVEKLASQTMIYISENKQFFMTGTTKIALSYWKGPHLPSFAVPFLDSDVPEFSWGDFQGDDGHCHGVAP